jgi:hypothetical protein
MSPNIISGNRALLSLNLADNAIGGKIGEPGVHALANMLRGNSTLRELNVASNKFDSECAKILGPAISDNGALAKLDISNNHIEQGEPLQLITELCNTKGIELDNESDSDSDGM